jgi:hypothetical protein
MPRVHENMNISHTVIMIKSAGAKFPPEYPDGNLIVKTQCVKQMGLSDNCRASLVVSVISKTHLAQLIQSPLQHSTVVAVFMYASFIPVTDPHTTKFASLSHISPGHLTVSEHLS